MYTSISIYIYMIWDNYELEWINIELLSCCWTKDFLFQWCVFQDSKTVESWGCLLQEKMCQIPPIRLMQMWRCLVMSPMLQKQPKDHGVLLRQCCCWTPTLFRDTRSIFILSIHDTYVYIYSYIDSYNVCVCAYTV